MNIIQGPLAGVSTAPFRRLLWRYSQPAFACTEMISCKTLIYQPALASQRYMRKDPAEGPVCFQLSGTDPAELAEAVQIATDSGADLIDLNAGCPVKKIRSRGAGSGLLMQPHTLYKLITAMKQHTHLPVSVKIRVESREEKHNQLIAQVVAEAGVDYLIVHGRHWREHYETPCRHEDIQFFAETLSVPVIGNGDVACVDSLRRMLATGCAGVMIGRAGVGQPWLIQELIANMHGLPFNRPSMKEIGDIYHEHVLGLVEMLGNETFAVFQARKFAKYYARGMVWREAFAAEANRCHTVAGLKKAVDAYFNEQAS